MSKFWLYEDMLSKDMGYRLFGVEHIAIIVLVIFSIIISGYLYNRLSNRDKIKHMLGIASICLIIIRIIYCLCVDRMSAYELPLHLCSIAGILSCVNTYSSKKLINGALFCVFLPGLISAIIFPNGNMYPVFSFITIQSFLFHGITIIYIIFEYIDEDNYMFWNNLISSVCVLAFITPIVALFNKMLNTNYLFLRWPSMGSPLELIYKGNYSLYLIKYLVIVLFIIMIFDLSLFLLKNRN